MDSRTTQASADGQSDSGFRSCGFPEWKKGGFPVDKMRNSRPSREGPKFSANCPQGNPKEFRGLFHRLSGLGWAVYGPPDQVHWHCSSTEIRRRHVDLDQETEGLDAWRGSQGSEENYERATRSRSLLGAEVQAKCSMKPSILVLRSGSLLRSSSILSTECMTVEWCLLLNCLPMSG